MVYAKTDWHAEIGRLSEMLAHEVNRVATSKPILSDRQKGHINAELGSNDPKDHLFNIARLPDELIYVTLQAAGGCVHNMGLLVAAGHANLTPLASLARTAFENAATAMHIVKVADPVLRTLIAADFMVKGFRDSRMGLPGQPFEKDLAAYQALVQKARREKVNGFVKWPNRTALVEKHFADGVSGGIYRELSEYTHPNAVTSMFVSVAADVNPLHNYVLSFRVVARASMAIAMAAASVSDLRERNKDQVVQFMGYILELEQQLEKSLPGDQ